MNLLQERYKKDVVPALMKDFSFKNVMEVPTLKKIVVNIGMGEALDNPNSLDAAVKDISSITGQKPVITKAKKSVANFKLREGRQIGIKVTLRGEKMWALLDRLVNIAMPRVRDLIFPEISYDSIDKVRGMEITFVTSAGNDEQAKALLGYLGMPFRKA